MQWLVQASVVVRLHRSVNRMPDLAIQIDPLSRAVSPGRCQDITSGTRLTETVTRGTIATFPEKGTRLTMLDTSSGADEPGTLLASRSSPTSQAVEVWHEGRVAVNAM